MPNIYLIFQLLSLLQLTRELITQQLNPSQQSFQKTLSLINLNNIIYLNIQFKYTPFSYLNLLHNSESQEIDQQYIFSLRTVTKTVLQAYLNFDEEINLIVKIYQSYNDDTCLEAIFQLKQQKIEGQWYSLEFYYNQKVNNLILTLYQNSDKVNIIKKFYENFNLLIDDFFTIIVGANEYQPLQNQLQGLLIISIINNSLKPYPKNDACQYLSSYQISEQAIFSRNNFLKHQIQTVYSNCFGISSWIKINQTNKDEEIQILKILSSPNKIIDESVQIINVIYGLGQKVQYINLVVNSYKFPHFTQTDQYQNLQFIMQFNEEILYQWHFFVLYYTDHQVKFSLQFPKQQNQNLLKIIPNINIFSNLSLTLFFGGSYDTYSTIGGQFNLIQFYNNLDEIFPIQETCHFTCETCFGPFINQCLTCSEFSNRELNLQSKCLCKIGYIEQNYSDCQTYYQNGKIIYREIKTQEGYDFIDQNIVICSFGYFKYQDQCIKCPFLKKQYPCYLCLANPNTWIIEPKCLKGQFQSNINNVFYSLEDQSMTVNTNVYLIYFFSDEQLILCDYCESFCLTYPISQYCYLSKYNHLGKQVYVTCIYGAKFQDGICKNTPDECSASVFVGNEFVCKTYRIETQIIQNCIQEYGNNECSQCSDLYKFFLSFDRLTCLPCQINNCQICFQYYQDDHRLTSLINLGIQLNVEDLIIGCAQCDYGFQFDFSNGICLKVISPLTKCSKQYIDENQKQICFESQQEDFKYEKVITNCQNYQFNCITCISPIKGQYYCIQCEYGYYFQLQEGICLECSIHDQSFISCQEQQQDQQFTILQKVIGFLFTFSNIYPVNRYLYKQQTTINPLECIQGQIPYKYMCLEYFDQNCNDYQDTKCIQCNPNQYGIKRLTLINKICIDCPSNCEYCQIRTGNVKNINIYYNVNSVQDQFQCLQIPNHKELFIDNRIGLVKICQGQQFKKCQVDLYFSVQGQWQFSLLFYKPQQFNQNYLIEIGVNRIIINYQTNQDIFYSDSLYLNQQLLNQFSSFILGLQSMEIQIIGNDPKIALIFGKLNFVNFQSITFQNISLNFSVYCDSQLTFKSLDSAKIILQDVRIQDTYATPKISNQLIYEAKQYRTYQFQVWNPAVFKLLNVIIRNMTIYKTSLFFLLNSNDVILEQIIIDNLTITNCTFIQSNFLYLQTKISYKKIIIRNFNILNCNFIESSLLLFQIQENQGQFIMSLVNFFNSTFNNSVVFLLPQCSNSVQISQLNIQQCQLNQTTFVSLQSDVEFSNLFINDCIMVDTVLIKSNYLSDTSNYIKIQSLKCEMIKYLIFILILNDSNNLQKYQISGIQILQMVSLNSIINKQYSLFQLIGEKIILNDVFIQKSNGLADFIVQNFQSVIIQNITISSQTQEEVNQIFQISAMEISIFDLKIFDLKLIDVVMIQIKETNAQQNCVIHFENVEIWNISIMKVQTNKIPTLIQIFNSFNNKITLLKVKFDTIWENQYRQDPEINQASLLICDTSLSEVILQQINIFNCLITNSSDSLILIKSSYLEVLEMTSNYTNDYSYYYKLQSEQQLLEDSLISIARLMFVQTTKATIQNCYFSNGIGSDGGIFYILTQLDAILNFFNLTFLNINLNTSYFTQSLGGCIYIMAENSNLNLKMNNLNIYHATSYQAGFLYIKGSINLNQISLQNIQLQEVFSDSQSIISFVSDSNKSFSQIELKNIKISNSEMYYYHYLQNYLKQEKNYSKSNLGQITITRSQIKISNLSYHGFAHESILFINFYQMLHMDNIYLNQIQSEDSQQFVYIEDTSNLLQSTIKISSMFLMNSQARISTKSVLSLISIILSSQAQTVYLKQILIYNNTCQECQSGILYFKALQTQNSKPYLFAQIALLKNYCGNSCLFFGINSTNNIPTIKIEDSQIIMNKAINGTIFVENFNLSISKTTFTKNLAQLYGGSIMASAQEQQQLNFQSVYFQENQAQVGGSIFLSGNSFINNIDSIYNIDNKAKNYSNNIAEQPSYLNLLLNGDIIQNLQISKNTYIANVQMLYFPSGIALRDYEIFDYTKLKYLKYQFNLQLGAYNNLMEKIDSLQNTRCIITFKLKSNQNNQYQYILTNQTQEIFFDDANKIYDLNNLKIILNPYQNFNYIEASLKCNSIQPERNLIFKISSYKCQIGEYFYLDQCLKCQSSAGYYSTIKQSISCKRVDVKIINQTDGAMIQLQPGFWRPHLRSDMVEECQKFPNRCLGGWIPGDTSCQFGAIGALCEDCDIYNLRGFGKFLNDQSPNCKLCGSTQIQIIFLILSLLWTTLLIITTIRSTENTLNRLIQLKLIFRKYQTLFKYSLDQTSILIKMANNYIQILTIIYSFQTDIFINLKDLFRFFGENSNIAIYQIDCTLSNYFSTPIIYIHFIALIIIPFFNFTLTTIFYLLGVIFSVFKYFHTYIFTTIIYIYIQNQQIILNNAISLISKRNVSGDDYIQNSLFNKYFTNEHFNWSSRFIFPIIYIVGICIPITLILVLIKNKKKLYLKKQRAMFSYLINEYSDSCYYWEIIRVLEKLFIVFVANFFEQFFQIKAILLIICITIYCQFLLILKPYRQTQFNILDFQISFNIATILLLLILLEQLSIYSLFNYSKLLELIILLNIFQLCVRLILKIFQTIFTKFSESIDPLKQFILKKFPQTIKQLPSLKKILILRSEQKIRIYNRFYQIKLLIKEKQIRHKDSFSERNLISSNRYDRSTFLSVQNHEIYSNSGKLLRTPTEIQQYK